MTIKSSAVTLEWTKGDIRMFLAFVNVGDGHYCGYCTFPKRPVREPGYHGILDYVPVHGGITYADCERDGSMTYGFDCGHCDDEVDPKCRDEAWLVAETERMAQAIELAVPYEPSYLIAASDEEKAKVIDAYHKQCADAGITFDIRDNFSVMLNVLFGNL